MLFLSKPVFLGSIRSNTAGRQYFLSVRDFQHQKEPLKWENLCPVTLDSVQSGILDGGDAQAKTAAGLCAESGFKEPQINDPTANSDRATQANHGINGPVQFRSS